MIIEGGRKQETLLSNFWGKEKDIWIAGLLHRKERKHLINNLN